MYKKIITGLLLIGRAIASQSQETGMIEQLAALRGYVVTTEKGYRQVEDGLQAIWDIRRDEFSLHHIYFASLFLVNPAIKNSSLVSMIVESETGMLDQFTGALARWRSSVWLPVTECRMIQGVYASLLRSGTDNVGRMQSLVADSGYILTDGERLRGIEKIAATVKAQAEGVSEYIRTTDGLIAWRRREYGETNALEKLIGNF